jgi:Asp/Glu/hydantoin racemase
MKTIAVILPVNNPEMLSQSDIDIYSDSQIKFILHTVDTPLKEINTMEDAAMVENLVINKIQVLTKEGTAAIIVYAFGEFEKVKNRNFGVPVCALGPTAILEAGRLTQKKFTIICAMKAHNAIFRSMVPKNLETKFSSKSPGAPEVTPAQIRQDKAIVQKLVPIAEKEILEHNVDTFTLGCGAFVDVAKPLEKILREKFNTLDIHVIDPIQATFDAVKKKTCYVSDNF